MMILHHVKDEVDNRTEIISVVSDDTGVIILLLHFYPKLDFMWNLYMDDMSSYSYYTLSDIAKPKWQTHKNMQSPRLPPITQSFKENSKRTDLQKIWKAAVAPGTTFSLLWLDER